MTNAEAAITAAMDFFKFFCSSSGDQQVMREHLRAVSLAALPAGAPAGGDPDALRAAASNAITIAKGIWHADPTDACFAVKEDARQIIDGLRSALGSAAPPVAAMTEEHDADIAYYQAEVEDSARMSLNPSDRDKLEAEVVRIRQVRRLIQSHVRSGLAAESDAPDDRVARRTSFLDRYRALATTYGITVASDDDVFLLMAEKDPEAFADILARLEMERS